MNENNLSNKPIISIKTVEKNLAKTYTDTESTIKTLEKIADLTHRSFNEVLKEIVNNFIQNGNIYDPDEDKYFTIEEIINRRTDGGDGESEKS